MDFEDLEILQELITESQEHLTSIEPDLLELDEKGSDVSTDLINRVFRAIHSIKGGFGFFGVDAVVGLTHVMESVLMKVRDGDLAPSSGMIDHMLEGVDKVREMIGDIENADKVDVAATITGLEPFLADTPAEPESPAEEAAQEEISVLEGTSAEAEVIPAEASVSEVTQTEVSAPEIAEAEEVATAAAVEPVTEAGKTSTETVKTESVVDDTPAQPPVAEVTAVTPEAEVKSSPPVVAKNDSPKGKQRIKSSEALRVKVDLLNQLMNLAGELVLARNQIVQVLSRKLNETTAGEGLLKNIKLAVHDSSRKLLSAIRDNQLQQDMNDSEYRDKLSGMISREMERLEEQLKQGVDIRLNGVPGLNTAMGNIDTVTTDLQESIMRTRMQPLGAVFNKFPRLIRELSKKTGKEINLVVTGNEVELDKSIIESLSDPLVHLLRNSADHGVESPDDREQAGKSRIGQIGIRAFHEGGQVNIEITDDGAGIDAARIRDKAVEKEIITQDQAAAMDDKEALKLIFAAGFSMSKEISDVSGRGVGMDVVRTNIEGLGGAIDIDTEVGKGTVITLRLPLTLAIIPSLIVSVADRRFAVPQVSLDELVRLRRNDSSRRLERVQGVDVLRLRGKLLPVIRLADLMDLDQSPTSSKYQHNNDQAQAVQLMVLKMGSQRYGLVVDEVLDSEEIVVKPLPAFLKEVKSLAGATIMGDGKVAMILDVTGIADTAELKFSFQENEQEKQVTASLDSTEIQTLLLFRNHPNEMFAINLALVSRIERVDRDKLEKIKDKEYLRYSDHSLRLIRLHDFMEVTPPFEESEELFVIIPKLVAHPMGILVSSCDDVITEHIEVDRDNIRGIGVIGSAVIEEQLVTFLDIYSLFEAAEPELCRLEKEQDSNGDLTGHKILLAEDTPFFRAVEKKYLEGLGCKVDVAVDGAEAWKMLNESKIGYDILLTDIEMPNMNGLELTRHVRASAKFRDLPVVALSALGADKHKQAGIEAGVTAYEVKFDKYKLGETLSKIKRGEAVNV